MCGRNAHRVKWCGRDAHIAMRVEKSFDTDDVKTRKTDDRGRVRLGPEYANQEVEVVVVETRDHDERDAQPAQ